MTPPSLSLSQHCVALKFYATDDFAALALSREMGWGDAWWSSNRIDTVWELYVVIVTIKVCSCRSALRVCQCVCGCMCRCTRVCGWKNVTRPRHSMPPSMILKEYNYRKRKNTLYGIKRIVVFHPPCTIVPPFWYLVQHKATNMCDL